MEILRIVHEHHNRIKQHCTYDLQWRSLEKQKHIIDNFRWSKIPDGVPFLDDLYVVEKVVVINMINQRRL